MLGNLNFLTNLHLVIILHLNLKIRRGYTPSNTSDYLIKSFQRGYSDSKIACQQQNFVNLAEPWIIFRIMVDNLRHCIIS
jgi:hypothetical protein